MSSNVESILKFNLDTEEGRRAHMRACKAEQSFRSINEIDEYLRKIERYQLQAETTVIDFEKLGGAANVTVTPENINIVYALIYGLRRKIANIVEDNGIDMEEDYL